MGGETQPASSRNGNRTAANFAPPDTKLEPLLDEHVLGRDFHNSASLYRRGRVNEGQLYVSPFDLDQPPDDGVAA